MSLHIFFSLESAGYPGKYHMHRYQNFFGLMHSIKLVLFALNELVRMFSAACVIASDMQQILLCCSFSPACALFSRLLSEVVNYVDKMIDISFHLFHDARTYI